jgi:hypothetical protein
MNPSTPFPAHSTEGALYRDRATWTRTRGANAAMILPKGVRDDPAPGLPARVELVMHGELVRPQ